MHVEKNICDNVLGTFMNIEGKAKDTIKARQDLCQMGLKKELHLKEDGGSYLMPHASYTLSSDERKRFCAWIESVKFPDGYASNISRCVNVTNRRISGMKSHDCHVFLQRLLPIAIRGYLRKDIRMALIELCVFFKELCSRTLKVEVLKQIENNIAIILCKFEMIFPPAFFDIMVHLAIHLPREALLAGPVQFRWMYPIERFLGKLKRYVRNRAHPEGSIAEAYIDVECLTFCSMYFHDVETRFNRVERNIDIGQENESRGLSIFSQNVRPLGSSKLHRLHERLFTMAQWYVLNNCTEIECYLR